MYHKVRLSLLAVLLLVCMIFSVEGQLNFSPGWGKRSLNPITREECSSHGKPSLEQLLSLYNLIQAEAQKILDCQKFNK